MAADAQLAAVGTRRFRHLLARVRAERAVTCLAGHPRMAGRGAKLDDVGMTAGARRLPGVHRRQGARVVDRPRPIVAEPAEIVRHHLRANRHEEQCAGAEDGGQANEVASVADSELHPR